MEDILSKEDLIQSGLTEEDLEYIDKEMTDAIELTIDEVEEQIDNDDKLNEETDEMFATDDVNERIDIWKKHHPNEEFYI